MYASEKTESEPMTVNTTLKNIVGEINGNVMLTKRRQGPAPSMWAASYISCGTPCRAARKMIMRVPPIVPPSETIATAGMAQLVDCRQAGPSFLTNGSMQFMSAIAACELQTQISADAG